MSPTGGKNGRTVRTKVERLIEDYGLGEDYGEQLENQWVGEGTERKSLRKLAEQFNKRLLEAVMNNAGMKLLDGEIDNMLRLLTDNEVQTGSRIEARRKLEKNGIDVDRLETDFVTYQAIRSYLKNHRNIEYNDDSKQDRIERTSESLMRLRSRLESVSQGNLEQLRDNNQITLDDFSLYVSINVFCKGCETQYSMHELLDRGGCNCGENNV